jgi:hypothetical protein
MLKSTDQILAEKLARKELEIANLLAANQQLTYRLREMSDEVTALKQYSAQPAALRPIHDEGDEANGSALWH